MEDPKKPEPDKLEEGLKGINLDKFGDATQKLLQNLIDETKEEAAGRKKVTGFFKKAKAALNGNEKAKEELSDSAAKAWLKVDAARKSAGDILDKAGKKIAEARDRKPQPPKS